MKRPFAFVVFCVALGVVGARSEIARAFSPPAPSPALVAALGALRSGPVADVTA